MTKSFLPFISLFAAGLLAGGCAGKAPPYRPPVESGYRVQINRAFEALPNYSRIYFQQGSMVDEKALDRWNTYCRLRLFDRDRGADYSISVVPGKFDVTSVKLRYQSSEFPYYGIQAGDTLVGFGLIGHRANPEYGWMRDDPPSYYLYRVEMWLQSATQPDVRSLTCSRKWSTRGGIYPSLEDIREALGELIEIDSPA